MTKVDILSEEPFLSEDNITEKNMLGSVMLLLITRLTYLKT